MLNNAITAFFNLSYVNLIIIYTLFEIIADIIFHYNMYGWLQIFQYFLLRQQYYPSVSVLCKHSLVNF